MKSKYAKLIDESDIKWFADLGNRRLEGREDVVIVKEENTERKNNSEGKIEESSDNCDDSAVLSYTPIKCPIFNCDILFLPNDMAMHFLCYHKTETILQRIFEDQRLFLQIKPFELPIEETVCLGLLSYGGKKSGETLAEQDLCLEQNLLLFQDFLHLKGDYPIFILAYIAKMDLFGFKKGAKISDKNFPLVLVIWLAGADIKKPIYCTITAFNECRVHSTSTIINVRKLHLNQNPKEFCNNETEYFRMHFGELSILCDDKKTLTLEFKINEDFQIKTKE